MITYHRIETSNRTTAYPSSKAAVLRNPLLHGELRHELPETDLNKLIEENIFKKYGERTAHLLAFEVKAFVSSLSEENRKKFIEVVKAFEMDKEKGNLNQFIGEIWAGGGMMAIAGSSAGVALTTIALLVGMNLHSFLGTSAGAFHAATKMKGCTNSQNLNETIEAPYHTFPMNRGNLEAWINNILRKAHKTQTGEDVDIVKLKHMKETGGTFEVMAAELSKKVFPFNYLSPDIFPFFASLKERYEINPDEFPVAQAIGTTTYFPGLMFNPFDPNFGNHFIVDKKGKRHAAFDPGLASKNRVPLDSAEEQIKLYKSGKIEKPEIFFTIDYKIPTRSDIKELKNRGGLPPAQKSVNNIDTVINCIINVTDAVDNLFSEQPFDRLKRLGLQRTFFLTQCARINPFTKEISVIRTGDLTSTPKEVSETIVMGGIPTSDFKDSEDAVVDELYKAFVDKDYLKEKRAQLSPYELILRDIHNSPEMLNGA